VLADIRDSVRARGLVGAGAVIDSFVNIKMAVGSGDVKIGPDCVTNSTRVLYTANDIRMGKGVASASNCTLVPTNHIFHYRDVPIRQQAFRPNKADIVIDDDVWIGTILRQGYVIGAASVVQEEVPVCALHAGNSSRLLG
jgi:acetyltransferase-like isoleucine patch superfamily enzyme